MTEMVNLGGKGFKNKEPKQKDINKQVNPNKAKAGNLGNSVNEALKQLNAFEAKKKRDKKNKNKNKNKKDSNKNDKDKEKDNEDGNTSATDGTSTLAGVAFNQRMSAEIVRDVVSAFITSIDNTAKSTQDESGKTDKEVKDSEKGTGYDASGNKRGAISQLLYKYQLTGAGVYAKVKDLLTVDIPDDPDAYIKAGLNDNSKSSTDPSQEAYGKVFNVDESMMPSPPKYLGYNGSILSMISDLTNKPFNESYFTHEEGNATLHYRQTPFEEDDWFGLDKVTVTPDQVLSYKFELSDQEQYSIFKLTSSTQVESSGQSSGNFILPITDDQEELVGRYGYKTMEQETEYFDNPEPANKKQDSKDDLSYKDKAAISGEDQTGDETASKFYPSLETVLTYPKAGTAKSDEDKNKIANDYNIDSYYGGNALYAQTAEIAKKKNTTAEQRAKDIVENAKRTASQNGLPSPISQSEAVSLVSLADQGLLTKYSYITKVLPDYEQPFGNVRDGEAGVSGYLSSASGRKEHPNKSAADIVILSDNRIGSAQARAIIDSWNKYGTLSASEYARIMSSIKHSAVDDDVAAQVGKGKKDKNNGADKNEIYDKYQRKLFNWYADNSKFYSGSIQVVGRLGIEFGKRLYFTDDKTPDSLWEFYIESVEHSFDYQSGWITTIGVTRGLRISQEGDRKRFRMFWGHYQSFEGGFFGEPSFTDALQAGIDRMGSSGGDSDEGTGPSVKGSKAANKAVKLAKEAASKPSIYGEEWHGLDYTTTTPQKGDCSSFVYFTYKHAGFDWQNAGSWPYTTYSIADSPVVKKVGGGSKQEVWDNLKNGDMVFWDTTGKDGHMGIYVGGGNCIAFNVNNGIEEFNASSSSSIWWSVFSGHVVRVK